MGLRALAPLVIVTSHWIESLGPNPLHQSQLSIDVFFAVEGFFAAGTMRRADPGTPFLTLLGRQLRKIYPLYVAGLLISVAVILLSAWFDRDEGQVRLIRQALLPNMLFVPVFDCPPFVFPLNPPTWAIALEIYVFALLAATRRHQRLSLLLPFGVVAAGACILASRWAHDVNLGYQPRTYWGGYLRCLFGFTYGVVLHHVMRRHGRLLPRVDPVLVWVAFLAVLFLRVRSVGLPLLVVGMPLIVGFGAAATNPRRLQALSCHAGRLAYPLYLLSFPLMMGCLRLMAAVGLPMGVPGLLLSYLLFFAALLLSADLAARSMQRLHAS